MNRPVVVPLSPVLFSPRQIPQLAEIARRSEASFRILDLVTPDVVKDRDFAIASECNELLARRMKATGRSYLASVVAQIESASDAMRVRGDQREGEAVQVLGAYAREEQAAMIVIGGDQGDGGNAELLSRTGKHLVRASGCPVFLLFTEEGTTRGTLLSFMDGSVAARAGFELALCAAHACGAEELTLQAVGPDLSAAPPGSDRQPSRPHVPLQ